MARGWESKSVEAQIDAAGAGLHSHGAAIAVRALDSARLEAIRKKENIVLSRTRVVHELESARNPRYKAV